MSKQCYICGKKKVVGGRITRRGLAKKKGGIGMHVVKNVKRIFKPNLQSAKIREGSNSKTVKICVSCIRSDHVVKA